MTPEELRLRELTERIRERARSLPAREAIGADPTPDRSVPADRAPAAKPGRGEPPAYWQEEAEERSQEARVPLQLEAGDLAARETACARLRALLADGAWHSALELVEAGGLRYGGRLHEIRRGLDGGPPLDVAAEPREHAGRQVWHYRRITADAI